MVRFARSFYSLAQVVVIACSAAVLAVGGALTRAADAFVSMLFSASPAPPQVEPMPVAPAVTGLHQTRAFTERRIFRAASRRCRAPDSVAFVTA